MRTSKLKRAVRRKRNIYAKSLQEGQYKSKVVPSKKKQYKRIKVPKGLVDD